MSATWTNEIKTAIWKGLGTTFGPYRNGWAGEFTPAQRDRLQGFMEGFAASFGSTPASVQLHITTTLAYHLGVRNSFTDKPGVARDYEIARATGFFD